MTFTYNEKALPLAQNTDYVPTLRKKAFLQWVKNRQKQIGPFRYYAVGEYGDRYGRPHYHMALFPTGDSQVLALRNAWRKDYGFTDEIELNTKLARYLAKYTTKKLTSFDDFRLEENQEPEFRASSKRPPLGQDFVERVIARYQTGQGRRLIQKRGDIDRTFKIERITYPIPDWALTEIRKGLGIPTLHRDRLKHPAYRDHFPLIEAIQDEELATAQWEHIDAMNRRKLINNRGL